MTLDDLQKNGRAIVLKSVNDAISVSVTALIVVAVGSMGLSLYRLSNGKAIQGSPKRNEEENGP